jgi:hypothetical protein
MGFPFEERRRLSNRLLIWNSVCWGFVRNYVMNIFKRKVFQPLPAVQEFLDNLEFLSFPRKWPTPTSRYPTRNTKQNTDNFIITLTHLMHNVKPKFLSLISAHYIYHLLQSAFRLFNSISCQLIRKRKSQVIEEI